MEVKREIIEIDMQCDKCGQGFMRYHGDALLTKPIRYVHICGNCKYEQDYTIVYPYVKR